MSKKRRPTLQDVASLVGVTKMTVSRYLKNPSQVSPATRDRLAAAVEQLGYIPNRAPDILSNAKSRAIGVLVPSLTNQVFAEVIRGIESVTEPAGYQLMFAHYGYSAHSEEQHIASLLSYNVDGLLLSETLHSERTLRMIETAGISVVEMMDCSSECIRQAVGLDNARAAYSMVETMIQRGYRQIAYLGARMDQRTQLRMQGYTRALEAHGLKPVTLLTEQASSFSLGASLLKQVLSEHPQTDGLFCTNDDLAIGALFECQRQGIQIPGELAIAGFHGHDIGQSMVPRLASVITPREQIGQVAARELLARLNDEPLAQTRFDLGYQISTGESI
ncbi:gluconate operon transcriptional repressor GntR [Dongshaea marina]|uniref:gluconate operon transcriptional repressor GntR n=1 Tax=Dongshaea marina TaxID=2047966 RepID=UPI000D3E180F|nr:gluconate operon transcriptional repressor GntR [Dongshaea marina]